MPSAAVVLPLPVLPSTATWVVIRSSGSSTVSLRIVEVSPSRIRVGSNAIGCDELRGGAVGGAGRRSSCGIGSVGRIDGPRGT